MNGYTGRTNRINRKKGPDYPDLGKNTHQLSGAGDQPPTADTSQTTYSPELQVDTEWLAAFEEELNRVIAAGELDVPF